MRPLNLWLLALLFFFANEATANSTIYINYETSCFDKYEYLLNDGVDQKKYYTYHIKRGTNERVILDVGTGASERFSSRPQNVKNCYELQFNEAFAKQINDGQTNVYILMQDSYGYAAIPVSNAAYFFNNYDGLAFATKDYAFNYNYFQDNTGTDLALDNSAASVFYAGVISNKCPKKFIFNKKDKLNGFNTQITMIPDVGIVELKSEVRPPFIANNKLNLVRVNNLSLDEFTQRQCSGLSTKPSVVTSTTPTTTTPSTTTQPSTTNDWRSQTTVPPVFVEPTIVSSTPTTTTTSTYKEPTYVNNYPSTTTTSTTTTYPNNNVVTDGTVYKDLDRGLFIDRRTGAPANGAYGGVNYVRGYMQGQGAVATTTTTPVRTTQPYVPPKTTYYPPAPAPSTTRVVTTTPAPTNNCNKPSRWGYHVVSPKETLYRISKQYGVSVSDIKKWNKLRSNKIAICSELRVKPPVTTTSTTQPANTFTSRGVAPDPNWKKPTNHIHIVQNNETLYSIGKKYGYTPERMMAMNGLTSPTIQNGQKLFTNDCNCPANQYGEISTNITSVPASYNNTNTVRLTNKGTTASKRRVHIVQKKETLYSIAKKYDIPLRLLQKYNNLGKNEVIIPFQKIYLEQ